MPACRGRIGNGAEGYGLSRFAVPLLPEPHFHTFSDNERYQTYGVEILWPVLLIQTCILRKAMASFSIAGPMFGKSVRVRSRWRSTLAGFMAGILRREGHAPFLPLDAQRCNHPAPA